MALAGSADFVLVRPSELMSRAWMKDASDAHARDCPNIKRIIKPVQPHQPLGGVGNSARHRRRADAPQNAQARHRAAATCRTGTGMYAINVGLNQWALQRLKGLWEKLPTKWEKRYARARPALQSQVELGPPMRALLRCEHEWAWPRLRIRACST
jgi:hypothetical protein